MKKNIVIYCWLNYPVRCLKYLPLILFTGTLLARFTGYWRNSISEQEYMRRIQEIDQTIYDHNCGRVPEYSPED